MELNTYVDALRRELAVAAEAGGDDARALAERMIGPLESSVRLTLLEALAAAAAEITRDLAPGSVEVRLRGREPEFVVTPPAEQPAPDEADAPAPAVPVAADAEDAATSRINFRLPDSLKGRIEDAAAREGLSVNAWLVRAATAAVSPAGPPARRAARGAQRYTGWVS